MSANNGDSAARTVDYQMPLKRVRGLGSARDGTRHFILQRVTAIALVPLCLWAVWLALGLMHAASYAQARMLLRQPCNAVLLTAFVIAVFWHARLGLQVVIEDYVHARGLEVLAQLAVKFFCAFGALTGVLAILRVAVV